MRQLRTSLLFAAALLMGFAAFVSATTSVPHLREDLVEINVRPKLLGAVLLGLHFSTIFMFAFACLVLAAAIQSLKSTSVMRLPLCIIALTYVGVGIVAFVWSGSHHALGYVLVGIMILFAILIPNHQSRY